MALRLWEAYCDDKLVETFEKYEKAEEWLSKMEATDAEQEYTWSLKFSAGA